MRAHGESVCSASMTAYQVDEAAAVRGVPDCSVPSASSVIVACISTDIAARSLRNYVNMLQWCLTNHTFRPVNMLEFGKHLCLHCAVLDMQARLPSLQTPAACPDVATRCSSAARKLAYSWNFALQPVLFGRLTETESSPSSHGAVGGGGA